MREVRRSLRHSATWRRLDGALSCVDDIRPYTQDTEGDHRALTLHIHLSLPLSLSLTHTHAHTHTQPCNKMQADSSKKGGKKFQYRAKGMEYMT